MIVHWRMLSEKEEGGWLRNHLTDDMYIETTTKSKDENIHLKENDNVKETEHW